MGWARNMRTPPNQTQRARNLLAQPPIRELPRGSRFLPDPRDSDDSQGSSQSTLRGRTVPESPMSPEENIISNGDNSTVVLYRSPKDMVQLLSSPEGYESAYSPPPAATDLIPADADPTPVAADLTPAADDPIAGIELADPIAQTMRQEQSILRKFAEHETNWKKFQEKSKVSSALTETYRRRVEEDRKKNEELNEANERYVIDLAEMRSSLKRKVALLLKTVET